MQNFINDKIRITCETLKGLIENTIQEITDIKYIPCGYRKPGELPAADAEWHEFKRNEKIQGYDSHFWFSFSVDTPHEITNKEFALRFDTGSHHGEGDMTNPQGIVFLNGKLAQSTDINHTRVYLKPDMHYDVILYFYAGLMDAEVMMNVDLITSDSVIKQLYYDISVPYNAAMCFNDSDYTHIKTVKHLEIACNLIDFRSCKSAEFYKSVNDAVKYLKEEYYGKVCGNSDAVVSYIGHTHIDVAWLWTLAQTREKAQRSFSNMLSLMERYPEFIFMSSQPQLYEYFKEEQPELYEKIKEYVKAGRWEVEGAMWLEADCNLSSGESLIRQILHGKRFMKDEFGVESKILWLPDVFGYSAALPQILKKTGVEKFVTSKISWNETNKMPYDSFMWQGIDGSEIFTYFLTAQPHEDYKKGVIYTTYNGTCDPTMTLGTWERYQQKNYSSEVIVTLGFGDGGGGTTEEMLEQEKRLEYGLPGLPKARISKASDALERIEKSFYENCRLLGRTPKWVGELYLELHRGTYTSIGKNKKNNRRAEFLCQSAETVSVACNILRGNDYPYEVLNRNWRTVLLNQFHDIIPGSSIEAVYKESDRQYAALMEEVGDIKQSKLKDIAQNVSKKGIFVYNPNSFTASGYAKTENGERIFAENIPPFGWKTIDREENRGRVRVCDGMIDSNHYTVTFDECMNIISIFDKDADREVIEQGKAANCLYAFENYPKCYDNWEITDYYKQKKWLISDVKRVEIVEGNGFGGFLVEREYMNSLITQRIILYNDSRRIDFVTDIDWHEQHTLLRTVFPTTVHANKASYDIQFGNVERTNNENTSWDRAKFEVCAQKWGDISEEGYGVSLLNDCKYGYAALENEISLTLIKSGTYPNKNADIGKQSFVYSLYPHMGGFKQGGTIQEAYLLNRPLEAIETNGTGTLPSSYSLISCDCENIIIETVKQAESGNGIIVRLYDAWNKKSKPVLTLGFDAKKIFMCDMLENPVEEIGKGSTVQLDICNFEIVTLLIECQ